MAAAPCDRVALDMLTVGADAVHIVDAVEQVALKLMALYNGGLDCVLIELPAYHRDTQHFEPDLMPLARDMGVIEPTTGRQGAAHA